MDIQKEQLSKAIQAFGFINANQFTHQDFQLQFLDANRKKKAILTNQPFSFQVISTVNDVRKRKADQGGATFDVQINGPSQIQAQIVDQKNGK